MNRPQIKKIVSATLSAIAIAYGPGAHAIDGEDGPWVTRNVSQTPTLMTEFANVQMAKFYVNAQNYLGTPVSVVYKNTTGGTVMTRTQAKPLVASYNDGREEEVAWTNPVTGEVFEPAFPGHGKRNAFSAISLDDGLSWKRTNLSLSGGLVVGPIFVVDHSGKYVCDTTGLTGSAAAALLKAPTKDRCDYFYYNNSAETPDPTPDDIVNGVHVIDTQHLVEEIIAGGGDVTNVSQLVIGNNILVAWVSKLCNGAALATGDVSPLNTITDGSNPYDVLGLQGYTDYALIKTEGELGTSDVNAIREIGKVPNSCLWTRRGQIVENAGTTSVVWYPAERLTSGVRDAYKLEVGGHENAGFAVVWQEDPEGLLPGSGEGPGEGWSGSTVNHKTDVWYSYLHLDNFTNPGPVMSIPVPITDNAKCPITSGDQGKQWCYADNGRYVPGTGWIMDGPNGLPDFCADGDLVYNSCIAEDGRYMEGQTGSSRPRINIHAYCKGNDDVNSWYDDPATPTVEGCSTGWSGWAAITYEESKGKGDLVNEQGQTLETGKNARFHTFEFTQPEPVKQGLLLNKPTSQWPGFKVDSSIYDSDTDNNLPPGATPDLVNPGRPVYDNFIVYRPQIFGGSIWSAPFFDTEIARRTALTSNSIRAAVNSTSKTSLLAIYKQGMVNQGGSADIMFRRFVLKDGFAPGSDNPFATMACARPATADELGVVNNPDLIPEINGLPNPNYLDGLCLAAPANISSTTPTTCDQQATVDPTGVACGYGTTNPFTNSPLAVIKRMFTWTQTQGANNDPIVDEATTNLDDESWTNAWDVAKGHRGILDGDFVMLQYAWAPNEIANGVGRDTYNLYIRRSFDGGQTFTTTPNAAPWTSVAGVVADGTVQCETFRDPVDGDTGIPGVAIRLPLDCETYTAGAPERSRNVSLIRTNVGGSFPYPSRTVLDPRYTPTGGLLKHGSTAFVLSGSTIVPQAAHSDTYNGKPVGGDLRDPSIFFASYDDGDNITVASGAEAEPLDMYYAQAYNWGDDYTGITTKVCDEDGVTGCVYPTILQRLNALGTHASESSITSNPDGTFLYSIWNQWQYTVPGDYDSGEINEDAYYRRVMFLDGE